MRHRVLLRSVPIHDLFWIRYALPLRIHPCSHRLYSVAAFDCTPYAPTNIWDIPYELAFWAQFEARANAPARLKALRDSYEQSGLADTSGIGRVYEDLVWKFDGDNIAVKEEEMAVEVLLLS